MIKYFHLNGYLCVSVLICYEKKVVPVKRFISPAKRKYFFLENNENSSFMSGRNHGFSWLYM